MSFARRLPLSLALAAAAAAAVAPGCPQPDPGIPLDQPLFPTGLAIARDRLLVISSDFDAAVEEGALLSADLEAVRSGTAADGPDDIVPGPTAYTKAVILPALGDRPVVTSGGERAYVPVRRDNRVVAFDIAADGTLSCPEDPAAEDGRERTVPVCGETTSAMQLSVNDPFAILFTNETRAEPDPATPDALGALLRVDGIITSQSSPRVFFFSDDTRRESEGAARLQVTSFLELPEIFGGIRGAVLRPEVNGTDPVVIAGLELSRDLSLFGARLGVFFPESGAFGDDGAGEGELKTFDMTVVTGSSSVRDVALVAGEDGDDDALVVVLREPDALARFEIDDVGGLPDLRLTAVAATCKGPTALARAAGVGDAGLERVLVACFDGDTVEAIDPLTLRATDVVRFAGRGPYDVVVHRAPDAADGTPGELEAYVSFHFDGSIGALRFSGDRLQQTGRIGVPNPRPEDGRE